MENFEEIRIGTISPKSGLIKSCITFDFVSTDEEECHLREQVFEFVRNVMQLKLTESQLALFSAVVLIRAGEWTSQRERERESQLALFSAVVLIRTGEWTSQRERER